MTTTFQREPVTFHVTGATRDKLPLGAHDGFIEYVTIYLHGQPKTQLSKCMLHIERADYPQFFNPNNSAVSYDVDVLADVLDGTIKYA